MQPLPQQQLNEAIATAEQRLAEATADLRSTVDAIQADCEHRFVTEATYKAPTWYSNGAGPLRVCQHCGYSEDMWDHRSTGLRDAPGRSVHCTIYRDEAYKLIRRGSPKET